MNHILLSIFIVLSLFSQPGSAGETRKLVAVADFLNTEYMWDTVGARATAILHSHGIQSRAAGSRGISVCVPSDRVDEALQLLADAIKTEHLPLFLIDHRTPPSDLVPRTTESLESMLKPIWLRDFHHERGTDK